MPARHTFPVWGRTFELVDWPPVLAKRLEGIIASAIHKLMGEILCARELGVQIILPRTAPIAVLPEAEPIDSITFRTVSLTVAESRHMALYYVTPTRPADYAALAEFGAELLQQQLKELQDWAA
jgi:hypothetical protein